MKILVRQFGFTLSEILVTLTIIAILIMLAVPSFGKLVEEKRLKQVAEMVAADLNYFKQEGLKRRAIDFRFNVIDGNSWCYGVETGTCSCSTANDCSIRQVTGSDFRSIASLSSTNTDYSFNWVRGTMSSGSITINSTNGYDLRVVISGLGRTFVCSPSDNVAGYNSC